MVQFKVDEGQRKKELLDRFSEKTGDPVLTKCLFNRLEYGSKYSNIIEMKINEIIEQLELEHTEPPWLHLLD
jgi:hypothetical protein